MKEAHKFYPSLPETDLPVGPFIAWGFELLQTHYSRESSDAILFMLCAMIEWIMYVIH